MFNEKYIEYKSKGDKNTLMTIYKSWSSTKYESIKELFQSLCTRYQADLLTSLKGSDFDLNSIGMHYKCHKINLNRGKSHIDSPWWLKNKEATISPKIN